MRTSCRAAQDWRPCTSPLRISLLAVLGIVLLATPSLKSAESGVPPSSPDPRTGAIHGRVAIVAIPVLEQHGKTTFLSYRDCEVHLVKSEDETRELVYPCGSWFQPPIGRYLFWLEQGSLVSFQSVVYYAGERFVHFGSVFAKPLYPAGSVQLDSKVVVPAGSTFRILSLDTIGAYRPFDRRLAASNTRRPFRVPVGRLVAGVFDPGGRALLLSRLQRITAGYTTVVLPTKARAGSAIVVAVFDRLVSRRLSPVCNVGLIISKRFSTASDIEMQAYDRLVLIWYDLPAPGEGRLEVRCGVDPPLNRLVHLQQGAIATIRETLRRPQGVIAPMRSQ